MKFVVLTLPTLRDSAEIASTWSKPDPTPSPLFSNSPALLLTLKTQYISVDTQ